MHLKAQNYYNPIQIYAEFIKFGVYSSYYFIKLQLSCNLSYTSLYIPHKCA